MRGWATGHIAAVEVGVGVEEAGGVAEVGEVEIRVIEVGDLELEEVVVEPVRYRRSASSPPVPFESYSHLY